MISLDEAMQWARLEGYLGPVEPYVPESLGAPELTLVRRRLLLSPEARRDAEAWLRSIDTRWSR